MNTRWLCLLLLLPVTVFGLTETPLPPPLPAESGAHLEIVSTSPELTSISLNSPALDTRELFFDGEARQVALVDGEPFLPEAGSPAVPQTTRLYRIPNTGSVELVIRRADYDLLDSYKPYPYHDPEDEQFQLAESFRRDAWYPETIAEISEPMVFRDFRVVAVTLYPVQVNPTRERARYYSSIEVDIVANPEHGPNELLHPRTPSARYAPMYRELISNLDERALDEVDPLPGAYMILARDHVQINSWVDSLAYWRRLCGFEVTVDRRPSWNSNQMRTAIRDAYAVADPPLEFVCLYGDPQQSQWGMPVGANGEYDHFFTLADGEDQIGDIGVGRIPAASLTEAVTAITKLLTYERTPSMEDSTWFRRGFFYGHFQHSLASNTVFVRWAAEQFRMHTGLDSNIVIWYSGQVQMDTLQPLFEDGIGLFFWRGSWLGNFPTSIPQQLESGARLPVCIAIECGTGNYDWGFTLSEAFVVAGTPLNLKGGVCGIGQATSGGHAVYNMTLVGGLAYSMANMGIYHMGHVLNAGKAWLTRTYGAGSSGAINHSRWTNLMGDPALAMWTEVPSTFAVEHPVALPVGARGFAAQILDSVTQTPVKDAVVVLWKGDFDNPETYARALTDDSGRVTMPITVDTPGDLRLAVTKHNHKPYLFSIPCETVEQMISVENIIVDDNNAGGTSGNGDGSFNPGETIDLIVQVRNHGSTAIVEPSPAVITCGSPDVTIVQTSATFPPLAPDETAQGDVPFRISLSPATQHEALLLFTIAVEATGGDVLSSRDFICLAPDAAFAAMEDLGAFGPGLSTDLSLSIRNSGEVNLEEVEGELISMSPYIRVTQAFTQFGDIVIGVAAQQLTEFGITADSTAFRGQVAAMLLAIEDASGFRDTVSFELPIGEISESDPTGPDAYGYYAFDNADSLYDARPEFNYLDVSDGILGTNLNLNDPGEDVSPTDITSVVLALPFTFTYYGEDYDTITVCSNGWLAFGDQSWNDCFRNYPLPGINSASNMVAPYWDDLKTSGTGQGVWVYEEVQAGRFLIQWKASAGQNGYSEADLDFEVILHDPAVYPTRDGNGIILIQYNEVEMGLTDPEYGANPGCTVGMQDAGALVGLQYAFGVAYSPGAAEVVNGRAILFTTDGPPPIVTHAPKMPETPLPAGIELAQNYPNPFNAGTTFEFALPFDADVSFRIFDLLGREVATLAKGMHTAGSHAVDWNCSTCASGIYLAVLTVGEQKAVRKAILLK